MLTFYNKYAKNFFSSQNGEEGIVKECLFRMDIQNGNCVEIGANNGVWLSNTALLLKEGWTGKMVEAEHALYLQCVEYWKNYSTVKCQCSMVDKYNINAFVDDKTDVLSIDTDGKDYEIFKALKAKPKIIIIEIDSSIHPAENTFNKDGGAGYKPMVELAKEKGYFLLAHTGNLVLIDEQYRKLFPEVTGDPIYNHETYFKKDWLKQVA